MPNNPQVVGITQPETNNLLKINADGSINTVPGAQPDYIPVAAGQTDEALGTGAIGDVLATIVATVATAATSTVSVKDGAGSSIPVLAANTAIGAYTIPLNFTSTVGGWTVTTGAGVSIVATGSFTA